MICCLEVAQPNLFSNMDLVGSYSAAVIYQHESQHWWISPLYSVLHQISPPVTPPSVNYWIGCFANCWIEATKIRLGKVVTLVDSINSNHILIDDMGVDDMEVGEIYRDTIDRVSLTGDGIISRNGDYLNLGHIDESMVGKEVVFRYKGKFRAEVIAKHEADADNPIKEPNRNENDLLNGHL